MGHAAMMVGQMQHGSLGASGGLGDAAANTGTPKQSSAWPWVLGAAAAAGVVFAATRGSSMPNPSKPKKKIVEWDIDDAASLCGVEPEDADDPDAESNNCVYWLTAEGGRGKNKGWYVTVVLDSEHFTADLATDDGPYDSHADAYEAGLSAATEWIVDNQLSWSESEYESHRKHVEALRKK